MDELIECMAEAARAADYTAYLCRHLTEHDYHAQIRVALGPFKTKRETAEWASLNAAGHAGNANGSPKHPLYVPSSRTPVPWRPCTLREAR